MVKDACTWQQSLRTLVTRITVITARRPSISALESSWDTINGTSPNGVCTWRVCCVGTFRIAAASCTPACLSPGTQLLSERYFNQLHSYIQAEGRALSGTTCTVLLGHERDHAQHASITPSTGSAHGLAPASSYSAVFNSGGQVYAFTELSLCALPIFLVCPSGWRW